MDFYVIDIENTTIFGLIPFLLDRPFLKTTRPKIDVFNNSLTIELNGKIIHFSIPDAINSFDETQTISNVDATQHHEQQVKTIQNMVQRKAQIG